MRAVLLAALAFSLAVQAQTKLTVEQLVSFIESSIKLKHPDKQVAAYLEKLKLSEKLADRTIEDLQAQGAGPKTLEALRALRDSSQSLPAPAPKVIRLTPPPLPPPSAEEQKRVLDRVREYAKNYTENLPDFICTQVTRRYIDPSGLEFWQSHDVLTTRLSYVENRETYKLVMVNNQYTDRPYESVDGASSTGEFGSLMNEIFHSDSGAQFRWARWATLRGRRMQVYGYRIPQANSKWRISYQRQLEIVPGYSGLIFVDGDSGAVHRITHEADDIPPSFPIRQAGTVLDYDFASISEREYLLPVKAVVRLREAKLLTKNEVEFRMYRKFSADATITFTPEPLPEEQTREEAVKPPATK